MLLDMVAGEPEYLSVRGLQSLAAGRLAAGVDVVQLVAVCNPDPKVAEDGFALVAVQLGAGVDVVTSTKTIMPLLFLMMGTSCPLLMAMLSSMMLSDPLSCLAHHS